jgi:hypothetical protein
MLSCGSRRIPPKDTFQLRATVEKAFAVGRWTIFIPGHAAFQRHAGIADLSGRAGFETYAYEIVLNHSARPSVS